MSLALDPAIDSAERPSGKDRADENFPVGSRLIRPALRRHVHAYYLFARNADDIADSPALAAGDKIARLDHMQAVLLGEREGGAPSAAALRESLAETGVTPRHATDLLVAFRQDAAKTRYGSWEELLEYCRFSAMPVGRYVLDLHGQPADAHPASDALCAALQVLNHLQDCGGDLADLDRCYLPEPWLREAGGDVADLRGPRETPALRRVFDRLLDRVDGLHARSRSLPRSCPDRRIRLETAVIDGLSRRLAARLRREDPLATRVKLRRADVLGAGVAALRFLA